jgi:hypothetical protein
MPPSAPPVAGDYIAHRAAQRQYPVTGSRVITTGTSVWCAERNGGCNVATGVIGVHGIKPAYVISNPRLHDLIKSILQFDDTTIIDICSRIPVKTRILTNGKWRFHKSSQELLTETQARKESKLDTVWRFRSTGDQRPEMWIIHEVKTGRYNPQKEFNKYYRWSTSRVWIWGWRYYNQQLNWSDKYAEIIDIENILPLLSNYIHQFDTALSLWSGVV